jgi:hypothetical protein
MIGLLFTVVSALGIRFWIRQRRADRDTARRLVPRPLTYNVYSAADRALQREKARAEHEARQAIRAQLLVPFTIRPSRGGFFK